MIKKFYKFYVLTEHKRGVSPSEVFANLMHHGEIIAHPKLLFIVGMQIIIIVRRHPSQRKLKRLVAGQDQP